MNTGEQIDAFEKELDFLIDRYCDEFDLPLASVIGILHLKMYEITASAYEEDDSRNNN